MYKLNTNFSLSTNYSSTLSTTHEPLQTFRIRLGKWSNYRTFTPNGTEINKSKITIKVKFSSHMSWRYIYVGVVVYINSHLSLTLGGGKWLASGSDRLTPGPRDGLGLRRRGKSLLHPKIQTLDCPSCKPSHYTDWAIPVPHQ